MTFNPRSKLGPYEILSTIGSGGMGEVWKARDTRLGRIVAIKKIKEQHSERFKQEARSIAALNHPNICQIFDIGDDYLVLEYVEGKPLSSPIPEQEAVKLAIQIATALEAAHKKGIIHRDLKPSNILVSDEGTVKLLDFGLAKLYEQDQSTSNLPTADFPATQAGAILGTVAYMSPEQAQGQPADARSDIFSFGLVLYEMLSGKRAFSGESAIATAMAVIKDEPPPLKTSPALEKIVKRCLEKDPSARYQRMSELKVDLVKATAKKVEVRSEEPQPSIAVLPFVNMSGDKEQEYFSDGLAEEIINALTKIPGLKVIARTSSFYFRDKDVDTSQIKEKLNVQNILEGSVRKSGNRIRVTAQLIETADESHLWSERYDRELTDIFAIQDEISQSIAEKLRVRLSGDLTLIKQPTANIEAYSLCLKGRYHALKVTEKGLAKCKKYYEQAIEMDPNYALAWSGLASYYSLMGSIGGMPLKESKLHCRRAIEKALAIDETLQDAHIEMAILRAREFDWQGAGKQFQRAMQLAPESTDVWRLYAFYYLTPMNRLEEAIELNKKALELDPLLPVLQWGLGVTYFLSQQWNHAKTQFLNVFELDPNYWLAHMFLGLTYIQVGKPDEAIKACETAAKLAGHNPYALGLLGSAYAKVGRIEEAKKILKELEELSRKTYVLPGSFARIYFSLKDTDSAFYWMEKVVKDRDSSMTNIHLTPIHDNIRSHPRYKSLLRKMNLEP